MAYLGLQLQGCSDEYAASSEAIGKREGKPIDKDEEESARERYVGDFAGPQILLHPLWLLSAHGHVQDDDGNDELTSCMLWTAQTDSLPCLSEHVNLPWETSRYQASAANEFCCRLAPIQHSGRAGAT